MTASPGTILRYIYWVRQQQQQQGQQHFTVNNIQALFTMKQQNTSPVILLLSVMSCLVVIATAFVPTIGNGQSSSSSSTELHFFGPFSGSGNGGKPIPKIPKNAADRDKQAIASIKAAIENPKRSSFPLIECEFPPIMSLNKLGDGSLRSAMQVEDANIQFTIKVLKAISSPIPFVNDKSTWLLTSTAASSSSIARLKQQVQSIAKISSLQDGIPNDIKSGDICVIVAPSSRQDYLLAESIASQGTAKAVIIINAFAKDRKSIRESATMGYYLKPLTYNSQVVGYLVRTYPSLWTTIDAISNEILGEFTDDEILVKNTNTPDLRASSKLVQQAVDQRAIRARIN